METAGVLKPPKALRPEQSFLLVIGSFGLRRPCELSTLLYQIRDPHPFMFQVIVLCFLFPLASRRTKFAKSLEARQRGHCLTPVSKFSTIKTVLQRNPSKSQNKVPSSIRSLLACRPGQSGKLLLVYRCTSTPSLYFSLATPESKARYLIWAGLQLRSNGSMKVVQTNCCNEWHNQR